MQYTAFARMQRHRRYSHRPLRVQGKPLLTAAGDFRNPVEGHGWRAAAITADGEHVLGASDVRTANVIFAWSRFGKRQLDVIIEGAPPVFDQSMLSCMPCMR